MPNRVFHLDPLVGRLNEKELAGILIEVATQVRDILNDGGSVDMQAIHDWLSAAHALSEPRSVQRRLLVVAVAFLDAGFPKVG